MVAVLSTERVDTCQNKNKMRTHASWIIEDNYLSKRNLHFAIAFKNTGIMIPEKESLFTHRVFRFLPTSVVSKRFAEYLNHDGELISLSHYFRADPISHKKQ